MILNKLEIDNFCSIGSVEFDFKLGVTSVIGEIDGANTSNGAGKSSIFEAIYWCFSGKTVRQQTSSKALVRHGQSKIRVKIDFHFKGQVCNIERTWTDSKKTVNCNFNGVVSNFTNFMSADKSILDYLGLDVDILSLVSFFGTKFVTFLSLPSNRRAELLSLFVDITSYEKAMDQILPKLSSVKDSINNCDAVISDKVFKKQELDAKIDLLNIQLKDAISILEVDLNQIKTKAGIIRKDFTEVERVYNEYNKNTVLLDTTVLDSYQKEIDNFRFQLVNCDKKMLEINGGNKLIVLDDKIDKYKIGIENLNKDLSFKAGVCPVCKQDLVSKDMRKKLASLDFTLLESRLMKGNNMLLGVLKEKRFIEDTVAKVIASKENIRVSIDNIQTKLANNDRVAKNKLQSDNVFLMQKEKMFNCLEVLRKDWQARSDRGLGDLQRNLANSNDNLSELVKDITSKKEELLNYQHKQSQLNFWVVGYKDIKFGIFRNLLDRLSNRVTFYAKSFGLDFTKIAFKSARELASGRLKPEVLVEIFRNENILSASLLSAGELKRLNLACFFSFRDFWSALNGDSGYFLVLDEPFDNLDEYGRGLLRDKLQEVGEQIFLIDHNAEVIPDANINYLRVVKENLITKVIQ